MEAFLTSVVSLSPRLIEGKARIFDLKSIRHIGHCERMRALLDLGFGSSEPISAGSNVLTSREFFLSFFLSCASKRRRLKLAKKWFCARLRKWGSGKGENNSPHSKSLIFSTRMTILVAP